MKTYKGMIASCNGFRDRFDYLKLDGSVGDITFGGSRALNQEFYKSVEWRRLRDQAILRDSYNGHVLDLAHIDHPIAGRIIIHHIIPITIDILRRYRYLLLDLNNVVCTSELTQKAIHYGEYDLLPEDYVPRRPNDTTPWR